MSTPDWSDAWPAALARLECDVAEAEALLREDRLLRELPAADPWHPPAGLGPLPLALRPRVDAVLARQLAVAELLVSRMAGTARQAALLGRIDDGATPAQPGYVDCAL